MKSPIIFARIADMKYYQGINDEDQPYAGGEYLWDCESAAECFNFAPALEDDSDEEVCFGFVMKNGRGGCDQMLHLERMEGVSAGMTQVEGVTVVFCSRAPGCESLRVVGFYKNAAAYRETREEIFFDDDGTPNFNQMYSFKAKASDCVLLPYQERFSDRGWYVPTSGKNGDAFGFGRSNLWYAGGKHSGRAEKAFAEAMEEKIFSYTGENWTGKQVQA